MKVPGFIGRYMSPELFHAPGKLTEKMDLWALGCLAVEASNRGRRETAGRRKRRKHTIWKT